MGQAEREWWSWRFDPPQENSFNFCFAVFRCKRRGSISMLQIGAHGISSRGFRRSCLEWRWQSPSNNGVYSWGLRVSITSFRTTSTLLLQYFESAVPTDHRADSLDRECFADNWQELLGCDLATMWVHIRTLRCFQKKTKKK